MKAGDPGDCHTRVALNSGPCMREAQSPMGNNTRSDSTSPLPSPLPKFEWLRPSVDAPRLQWADWLLILSDQLALDFPGETGLYLASVVYGHSCQARLLGAIGPAHQEQLAQEEADRMSAWIVALEAEVTQPGGSWELSPAELSDDQNGGWDGHPAQPDFETDRADERSTRYWVGPPDDDVYMN